MIGHISDFERVFFIGIAGAGMSAIAQYLQGIGKQVSGSDRYFLPNQPNSTRLQLEKEGILCYAQNGEGIHENIDVVVVSTAIEDSVPEVQKAKLLGIPIIKRSAMLAIIARSKKTIAIGGTSGKSTTSAMLYQILLDAQYQPSIISGAGLVSIIQQGKIGNAAIGSGDWLIIEADESDGSIVQYSPTIGVLLNVDKDHQEIAVLMELFATFRQNTQELFIVNQSNVLAAKLSVDKKNDFGYATNAGYSAQHFRQEGFDLYFETEQVDFTMKSLGQHNVENAMAAIAVARQIGISIEQCQKSLANYAGIYRRHQLLGNKNGVWLIDDYAHNPAKCAASIRACQALSQKVIAWFQPHGYGPTKFLRKDFVDEIAAALRPDDLICMSEIFYAGGTVTKDISANDLVNDIKAKGKNAFFVQDRNDLLVHIRPFLRSGDVLLLMGARDPSLEQFAQQIFDDL